MTTTIPAIIASAPKDNQLQWKYGQIQAPRQPREHEVLVRMIASGICHTDIVVSSLPAGSLGQSYPKIMGHEGAGEVEAVGPGVTIAKPGDKVLLSFSYCNACEICKTGPVPYCENWASRNQTGESGLYKSADGEDVEGKYFGQSSFSSLALVDENSVVNVENLISTPEELKRCAPFGCGLMTGAGCVLYNMKPHDIVVVAGIGAVGAGAIMTAKIVGCKAIVAVDRLDSRLQKAKELGATHVYNTTTGTDFVKDIQALVDGQRITHALDMTGAIPVMEQLLAVLGKRGRLYLIGIPAFEQSLSLPMADVYLQQKEVTVNFLGDAKPQELVPQMVQWYKEGKFPVDNIIKFYRVADVHTALEEMKEKVMKPILKF